MIRITRGNLTVKSRKKVLKLAKGYIGTNSRLFIFAKEQIKQSGNFAYVGRKLKKRDFRTIWIARINAVVRNKGTTYSKFIGQLHKSNVFLNRKMLSFLAFSDFSSFNLLCRLIK